MKQIGINWYFYWIGCVIGGFVIGYLYVRLNSQSIATILGPSIVDSPSAQLSVQPSTSPVTILFTGDVMLGRSVNTMIASHHDATWPFINVASVMKTADITYINLENPFVTNCPPTDSGMIFCSDPGNVAGLVSSGVDVASLANNHTLNYGKAGLEETISVLKSAGILPAVIGQKVSFVRGDYIYTFLSYNDVGEDALKNMSVYQKQSNEIVIMTFHWGNEYQSNPTVRQVTLAHLAIDNGADVVIGAHPHWVQSHEIYMGKPIYYSLGNFVFDQEWSAETKKGLAVRFTYDGTNLVNTEELPVFIQNYGQPQWQ